MRRVLVLTALAGCGFHVGGGAAIDASMGDAPDAMRDAAGGDGPPAIACVSPFSADLVACYELEDDVTDGVLADSTPARRDATATGLTATMRGGSMAATVTPTARVYAPDSSAFDRSPGYTFALWLRPNTKPVPGDVQGILDHEQQYAVLLGNVSNDFQVRCAHTGVTRYEYTTDPPLGQWSWIACTWDGTDFCAYRWTTTGNHQRFCHRPTSLPSTDGAAGLAIGHLSSGGTPNHPLDGSLDGVQIYDRALTEPQLCMLLGQPAGCMPCTVCSTATAAPEIR